MTFKDLASHSTSTSSHTLRRTMHYSLVCQIPSNFFSAYGADLHCHLAWPKKKTEFTTPVWKLLHFCLSELGCGVWWGCAFINPRSKFRGTSCVWQHQWEHSDKEQTNYSQEILTQGWLLTFCVYMFFYIFLLFSRIVLCLITNLKTGKQNDLMEVAKWV